jgi:hypothetical protein
MTSRLRALVATVVAVLAIGLAVAPVSAAPVVAHQDCLGHCRF